MTQKTKPRKFSLGYDNCREPFGKLPLIYLEFCKYAGKYTYLSDLALRRFKDNDYNTTAFWYPGIMWYTAIELFFRALTKETFDISVLTKDTIWDNIS